MSIREIAKSRGVPAKRGQKVRVDGKTGVITSARYGYLKVRVDGLKHSLPCHPTWRFEYDVDGEFVKFGSEK